MKTTLLPITANRSHSYFSAFVEALDRHKDDDVEVCSSYAFVTLAGIQRMLSDCGSREKWINTQKNFLVGIYHGITEPSALKKMLSIPNSIVRIYLPHKRMELSALTNSPVFHPKVMAICNSTGEDVLFLQSGSANLTKAAIGYKPRNHEFTLAVEATGNDGIINGKKHYDWWKELWETARPATTRNIKKYAELRAGFFKSNPALRSNTEVPLGIGKAQSFFIEVGAGSGPPDARHQVEFPKALASFFGRCLKKNRQIILQDAEGTVTPMERPLSFKTTSVGVDIWRLGMPTLRMGGELISEKVILFQRTSSRSKFLYKIASCDSPENKNWIETANTVGHIGATHGRRPRLYGFWNFKD